MGDSLSSMQGKLCTERKGEERCDGCEFSHIYICVVQSGTYFIFNSVLLMCGFSGCLFSGFDFPISCRIEASSSRRNLQTTGNITTREIRTQNAGNTR